jgi:hypothetical protein
MTKRKANQAHPKQTWKSGTTRLLRIAARTTTPVDAYMLNAFSEKISNKINGTLLKHYRDKG